MDSRKEQQQHAREEEHKEAQTAAVVHSRGIVHAQSDVDADEYDYDSDELEEHHAAYVAAGQALAALRDPHRLPPQLRQTQQQQQQHQQQQQLQQPQQHSSQQLKQPQQPLSSLPWCQAYLERDEPPTKQKQRVRQLQPGDDDGDDEDEDDIEPCEDGEQDDEDDDEDDEESAALEELADLKREYGKPGSSLAPSASAAQRPGPLPALTAALALDDVRDIPVPLKPDAPVELLRVPGSAGAASSAQGETDEDWELLGLECDCPCLNCTATAVAPTFELFEQDARRRARQHNDGTVSGNTASAAAAASTSPSSSSSSLCACECIQLPPSGHAVPLGGSWSPAVIVDALEDFFRLRTHMHRVTFARAMAAAEKSIRAELDEEEKVAQLAGNAVSSLQRERRFLSLRRKSFSRSLVFLAARCRRDLRHLELLEACANQLGWNVEGAPEQCVLISASDNPSKRPQPDLFVECASPGPRPPILPSILIEFLSYFIPQQRGAHPTSHYDKCALTTLCSHLLHYLMAVGSADPSNRVVQECVTVCERMETDLPLADLVETELYKHVQARLDAAEEAAAAAKDTNAAVDAAVFPSDAPPSASSTVAAAAPSINGSPSAAAAAAVLEAFAGHWVIEGVVEPTGFSACRSSRAPPLLVLRPAVPTRSKMSAYKELERFEQQSDAAAAAATSSSAAKAASASSTPSLSLRSSSLVRVVVPHSVLELLSEASEGGGGGGRGWTVDLEIARYGRRQASPGETATVDEQYFHITKAGHVSCT